MATAMKKRGFSKKRVRSRRLKGKGQLIAKSKWKEIDIKPEDAHFDDTGGLVLFEELDDYELLTKRDYSEEQQDDSSDEVEFEEEKSKKKTKQDHEKRKIEETVGTKRRGKQLEVIAADSEDSDVEKDEEDENEEWKRAPQK
ncbi:histone H3.v1-like [Ptychodera flava]|uniref:histone H3.v1-like n=1 Tax=Ptychodera flava TaxID=63121 RepID=UPI00396AA630